MRIVGYKKGEHLNHYFTKDDLNTTCAVYAFVKKFQRDVPYRFMHAFTRDIRGSNNRIYALLDEVTAMTLKSSEEQLRDQEQKAKEYQQNPKRKEMDERNERAERREFLKYWKPYWDNTGWIGGYSTFFINCAVPLAIHLFMLGVCLFLSEERFYTLSVLEDPGFITLVGAPVGVGLLFLSLHIMFNMLGNKFYLVSIFYLGCSWRARRTTWLWRRPDERPLSHCKATDCDPLLLSLRTFRRSSLGQWVRSSCLNLFVWICTYAISFLILKYLLTSSIRKATYDVINPNNKYDHKSADFILLVIALALAWGPVLLLALTIFPIGFSLVSCFISALDEVFIFAKVELFKGPHTTKTWKPYLSWSNIYGFCQMLLCGVYSHQVFKRRLRDKRTIRFFVERMLFKKYNPNKTCPGLYLEHFAKVWNHIIEDLDNECLLCKEMVDVRDNKNKSEKELMTFVIHDKTQPTNWFYNTIDSICARDSINETAMYQLSRFINYLWNPNMKPIQVVECMRSLRIVIPVYNETIIESFDKITVTLNTNTSLLEHAIRKYHDEWSNFVLSFSDQKDRDRLIQLESAIVAKADNISKMYLLKERPNHKGEFEPDDELRMKVRIWVSNRFQYVCRTMKGAAKIRGSLRALLDVQMDAMDEGLDGIDLNKKVEVIRNIVERKVQIIAGAQVYAMPWSTKEEDLRAHRSYVEAVNHLVKLYGSEGLAFCYEKETPHGLKGFIMSAIEGNGQLTGREVRTYGHRKNTFSSMGQGKPLHQSFLLQFFDGSVVEAVDCNQDLNAAQAMLLPNALAGFDERSVKLIGFKEYITTINWSSAGLGAGYAEKVYGSIVQRSWTMMAGRLHYGHPDFIRGSSVMYETGMSNMDVVSEDVFLGLNILLEGGQIRYCDHYEIGKARDVCMDTTSAFQTKIAGGAPQVCTSRQVQRIMRIGYFCPLHQLTLFHTITSQYTSALLILVCSYLVSITRIILTCIQLSTSRIWVPSATDVAVFGLADSYLWLQIGVSMSIPGFFQSWIDGGFIEILKFVVYLKFLRQTIFGAFHLLNTATFFGKCFSQVPSYIPSGRTAGLEHKPIGHVIKRYFSTHFRICFHLLVMLIIVFMLTLDWKPALFNGVIIAIWFFSPFLFNHGSLSTNVGKKTWVKLSSENWRFVHNFGAYHLIPSVPSNCIERVVFKERERSQTVRLLKKMEENGEQPDNKQIMTSKTKSLFCCTRFILQVLAMIWEAYDYIYWVLFNYVFVAFILTGLHYINLAVTIVTYLIPFYALRPRDSEYEENRRKHVDAELLRMEQQLNEFSAHQIHANQKFQPILQSRKSITISDVIATKWEKLKVNQ